MINIFNKDLDLFTEFYKNYKSEKENVLNLINSMNNSQNNSNNVLETQNSGMPVVSAESTDIELEIEEDNSLDVTEPSMDIEFSKHDSLSGIITHFSEI